MNPAVTVGVLALGAMDIGEAIGYIGSQLAGGVAGALLLSFVLGGARTISRSAPCPLRSRMPGCT
jgi:glycerol uptake facilitator-like aquaporin